MIGLQQRSNLFLLIIWQEALKLLPVFLEQCLGGESSARCTALLHTPLASTSTPGSILMCREETLMNEVTAALCVHKQNTGLCIVARILPAVQKSQVWLRKYTLTAIFGFTWFYFPLLSRVTTVVRNFTCQLLSGVSSSAPGKTKYILRARYISCYTT